jgi:hypothetical protein
MSLDPPASHPQMTVIRIWPVDGGWRFDVQYPGPPRGRFSGDVAGAAAEAFLAAAETLRYLATTPMAQIGQTS